MNEILQFDSSQKNWQREWEEYRYISVGQVSISGVSLVTLRNKLERWSLTRSPMFADKDLGQCYKTSFARHLPIVVLS
jgi:hypothetical protein